MIRSKSALGADTPTKVKTGDVQGDATAHILARLVYTMLKNGTSCDDLGQDYY